MRGRCRAQETRVSAPEDVRRRYGALGEGGRVMEAVVARIKDGSASTGLWEDERREASRAHAAV